MCIKNCIYWYQVFTTGRGVFAMKAVAPSLARTAQGHDNLSGRSRGPNNALSHRDKAALNKLYNCTGETF